MKGKVELNLLGTSFTLSSNEDSYYLENVINQYKLLLNKVQNEMKIQNPLKVAIISGILATEEMMKKPSNSKKTISLSLEEKEAVERIADDLVLKIDKCLSDNE